MEQNSIVSLIRQEIASCKDIDLARIYGSWLYHEGSVDVDIAVIVPSEYGLVSSDTYKNIREIRKTLCGLTACDIDLVPHTTDELTVLASPLWYPRYNPSLFFGEDVKGRFPVESAAQNTTKFSFADLTAYVMLDNRTICRRQLIRSLSQKEARIFVSKLLHGPGNAVTYHACVNHLQYKIPPSNLTECFAEFDCVYGVNSIPALNFLNRCKGILSFEDALHLMRWYEHLVNLTLYGDKYTMFYNGVCNHLQRV